MKDFISVSNAGDRLLSNGEVLFLAAPKHRFDVSRFDISLFEIQIKESIISGYLINFAPQVLSYVTEFFPSLEEIINKMEHKELIV